MSMVLGRSNPVLLNLVELRMEKMEQMQLPLVEDARRLPLL